MSEKNVLDKVLPMQDGFTSDSGVKYTVNKWSMRKARMMGRIISGLLSKASGALVEIKLKEYRSDVAKAKAQGIKEDSDDYPLPMQYEEPTTADLVSVVPAIFEDAFNEIMNVISVSISTKEKEYTPEDIEDVFTMDDVADVLALIIEKNMSKKSLGKWKNLKEKVVSCLATEPSEKDSA